MFRAAMCPSSGELIVSRRNLVYVTLYRWPFGVHVWMSLIQTCTPSGTGVLLYKQLLCPMMDYGCPAARSHVRRLQVLQSKCLRLPTVGHWHVSNRQIHEELGVPLFADHVRALTASFGSKLADVGNPLVRQLGRYADRRLTPSPDESAKGGRNQQTSPAMAKSTKRIAFGADKPSAFRLGLGYTRDCPRTVLS
jgi:hypothetical protein